MPITLARGVDTATNPVTADRNIAANKLNFNANYRVVSEAANEVVLANLSAPLDAPETIRVAWSDITDIYKGTKVCAPTQTDGNTISLRGVSILLQVNGAVYDTGTGTGIYFPYSAHLVLKVPVGLTITGSVILSMLGVLMGSLFETGDADVTDRVASLLRGSLAPPDL